MNLSNLLGNGHDRPPAPEVATPDDVQEYNLEFAKAHGIAPTFDRGTGEGDAIAAKEDRDLGRNVKHKAEFPWLFDPSRGVRWDFDPIELRNLGQANTWVGMLVQSITKEVAETPWTIVEAEGRVETQKRLSTHPEERDPLGKAHPEDDDLPDATARRIHDLLMRPNPDDTWHDMVEMWLGDLLEIGSLATVKAFPERAYSGDDLVADPSLIEPRALQPTPPEVWTKDFHEKTGLLEGFWQFDAHRSPGSGSTDGATAVGRGAAKPTFFDVDELLWSDMTPRTNRRYGMPPTLLVKDFLQSLDLAISQEQQYLSRGSLPSGAAVFEEWDREELKEWKEANSENIKGKPWKWLTIAGKGGDFKFEPFTYNFQEMEYTERMKWYARVVASVFQVPTAVVGIEPERVNYNTFQGERENFENNTLGPYLQKLERIINADLIQPHWGVDYRFEFKPGMSESTRAMISERVRSEFDGNIRTRNEARREIGLPEVDPDENGFKDEVVEDAGGDEGPLGDLELSVSKDDETAKEFAADVFRVVVPEEDADEFDDRVVGIGVAFPNDDVFVDWRNEVFPDELENSHVSIYGTIEDLEQATGNVTDPLDTLDADTESELAASVVKAAAGGGSGNANLRKDEPLRETDEWHQFDVQPHMVEDLATDIADEVDDLFDAVLADEEVMAIIERLAGDEAEKSLTDLGRRLRELFEESEVVSRVRDQLREETADAAREAIENAVAETDADPDVDVEAIDAQLRDREVHFADEFAESISEDIRDTVSDGWAEGRGTREIASDIAEQADINEGWLGAERIARQELHIAAGEARSEFAAEIDKVEVWNDSGDGDRVRPAHQRMDGTWKWPGDNWVVEYEDRGVKKESVPGDSEPGIGCRCGVLLRDRETVDESDYAGDGDPR